MGFAAGFAAGAQAKHRREARRAQAQQRNQELEIQGYSFDENGNVSVRDNSAAQAQQLQAQEAAQLAKSLQNKLLAQETDKAFEDFSLTGDAEYLQRALTSDPNLQQVWAEKGVQMIGNIDFNNDHALLKRAGLQPSAYDTDEKREILRKNMYKIYDGQNWNIGLANKAAAETGVMRRLGNRRAKPIKDNYNKLYALLDGPKSSPNTAEGHKYESIINEAAKEYDLPPNLIAAMIQQESSFNKDAVGPDNYTGENALGLMQLLPSTAKELGVTDPTNPQQNIMGGAKYMRQMLDRFNGDIELALAAYNAGPGRVEQYNGVPPFGETQNYIEKIMSNFDEGEQYYSRSAEQYKQSLSPDDQRINTILEHRRGIANAEKGLSNDQVDRAQANATRELDQADRRLDIQAEQNVIDRQKIIASLRTDGTTTKQKDLNAAADSTERLLNSFGGEDQFFKTDFSDPKNYRKAYSEIVRIERLEGTELSEADKKKITDVRSLISLGDPASKLTAAQTGLLDSTLRGVEKYVNDNVDGTAAKTAYAAFRNSIRHALFGSALTENEIKAFNQAYGTLGQKLGPVLSSFETALDQVQAQLDSTANLMNPYSAKVRLGADQERLTEIRDALQARIDYIRGINPAERKKLDGRPPLDEIFKGE